MRIYEELFIVKPDAPEEEIDAFNEQVKQVVADNGGTVDKIDKWGLRKLAYRLSRYSDGYYVLIQFSAGPDTVREVERRLRVSDLVLKFLTVRIDEKLKWLEKRKKIREKRARKKPAPVHATGTGAAPGAPVAEAPGAPVAEAPGAPVAEAPGEKTE
jgi:small subunit ribosomal protein S6